MRGARIFLFLSTGVLGLAQQVVDLKSSDGAILKASFFASAKPGPGMLLLHQNWADSGKLSDIGMGTCGGLPTD